MGSRMDVRNGPARRIDDAGEKIGGARKDFHLRAMTLADLDQMTAAETATLVTKDNAWPVPDYAAMVAAGAKPLDAALAKVLRDKLSNAPVMHRQEWQPAELARCYVEMMGFLRDHLANNPTVETVGGAKVAAMEHFGYYQTPKDVRFTQLFHGVHSGRHIAIQIGRTEIAKAEALVAAGFPAAIEPWRRNATVTPRRDGTFVAARNGRTVARDVPTEAEAWRLLETSYEQAKATRREGGKLPLPPHLERLERTNDRRRTGSVTPEAFIEEFGFRGVEFGLWLPDKERQQVLDMAFDAMDDLALILDIDPRAVALHGNLAIAFGARGQGNASAHYETGRQVINATRLSGAGKVLHEFWHGFDHWLGYTGHDSEIEGSEVRWGTAGREERSGSRVKALPKHDPAVGEAIDAVMRAIMYRPFTDEEHDASLRATVAGTAANLPRWERELSALRAMPKRRGPPASAAFSKEDELTAAMQAARERAAAAQAELDRVAAGGPREIRGSRKSDYYLQALRLCGKTGEYWKRPIELFARAGEAWGFDRLNGMYLLSQYLVHSVEPNRFASDDYKGNPYPTGAERQRINAAFDRLVALMPGLLGERRPDADTRPVAEPARTAEIAEMAATETFEVTMATGQRDAVPQAATDGAPNEDVPSAPTRGAGVPMYHQGSLF